MSFTAVVVDDATAVRESLPLLMPEIEFVAMFADADAALARRPVADLVILDLHLVNQRQPTVRQGVAAIGSLMRAGYRVCAYTQEERRFVLASCLAAGALGVVSKAAPIAEARDGFAAVAAGRVIIPHSVIGLVEVLVRRQRVSLLSPRQQQVLSARARGLTYAEMSRTMHLSESTLRGYWFELAGVVSQYLQHTAPGDIEQALGLGPGDLIDPRSG
jgi:DNA-binding NarL/FixJ family response regulator